MCGIWWLAGGWLHHLAGAARGCSFGMSLEWVHATIHALPTSFTAPTPGPMPDACQFICIACIEWTPTNEMLKSDRPLPLGPGMFCLAVVSCHEHCCCAPDTYPAIVPSCTAILQMRMFVLLLQNPPASYTWSYNILLAFEAGADMWSVSCVAGLAAPADAL